MILSLSLSTSLESINGDFDDVYVSETGKIDELFGFGPPQRSKELSVKDEISGQRTKRRAR
jgi:hypothetical protein